MVSKVSEKSGIGSPLCYIMYFISDCMYACSYSYIYPAAYTWMNFRLHAWPYIASYLLTISYHTDRQTDTRTCTAGAFPNSRFSISKLNSTDRKWNNYYRHLWNIIRILNKFSLLKTDSNQISSILALSFAQLFILPLTMRDDTPE